MSFLPSFSLPYKFMHIFPGHAKCHHLQEAFPDTQPPGEDSSFLLLSSWQVEYASVTVYIPSLTFLPVFSIRL